MNNEGNGDDIYAVRIHNGFTRGLYDIQIPLEFAYKDVLMASQRDIFLLSTSSNKMFLCDFYGVCCKT